MLDKEVDPDLDDKWLNTNENLTRSSKARYHIIGRFKSQHGLRV